MHYLTLIWKRGNISFWYPCVSLVNKWVHQLAKRWPGSKTILFNQRNTTVWHVQKMWKLYLKHWAELWYSITCTHYIWQNAFQKHFKWLLQSSRQLHIRQTSVEEPDRPGTLTQPRDWLFFPGEGGTCVIQLPCWVLGGATYIFYTATGFYTNRPCLYMNLASNSSFYSFISF